MTNPGKKQEERRLADEHSVDGLLAEAGCPDDPELRDLLLELRSLRTSTIPEPSAEVAALMGLPGQVDVTRLEDWPRKHGRKKRAVFTSLAVAASLGIAGGAAAANDGLRSQAEGTIRNIISSFTSPAPTTPAPASPSTAPEPAPAVVPSPAVTTPVVFGPAAPSPVQVPGPEAPAADRQENPEAPGRLSKEPQKAQVPSAFPPAEGKPATPGASRAPALPPRVGGAAGGAAGDGDLSNNGNAKGKAGSDHATGQEAGHPKISPPAR
jgi:hypothetical protein